MRPLKRLNFRSLQAFEAVSRHMSVSIAAEELGITQSAVSHQIRQLSEELGEKLLVKQGRGVVLTPAGAKLAQRLQAAFTDIGRSVNEVIGGERGRVRIAVCSSFGPGWLIPRLPRFRALNPNVELQLSLQVKEPELTDAIADAFITAKPREPGFTTMLVREERLVAVGLPQLIAGFGRDLPLITTQIQPCKIGNDWRQFVRIAGLEIEGPPGGQWLLASDFMLALAMAKAGLGAALVPDFIVEQDLALGTLARLDRALMPTGDDYYLCIKEGRKYEPALDNLARWFRLEALRDSLPEQVSLQPIRRGPSAAR